MNKTKYYNVSFDNVDTPEALGICNLFLKSAENNLIFFINAHCFNIAQKNREYHDTIVKAEMLLNDGIGFRMGAIFSGIRIKENMNGTDFVPKLLSLAAELKKNVYLLGGEEGVAAKAKQKLESRFPEIKITGTRNGFFNFNDDQEIVADIIEKKTEILIVGMGVPRQELWLAKNKEKLKGVKISVAGGAVLDFISSHVKRAPKWMQKTGTEWLFRLYQEPRRLFKRYFIGIPLFFYNLMRVN